MRIVRVKERTERDSELAETATFNIMSNPFHIRQLGMYKLDCTLTYSAQLYINWNILYIVLANYSPTRLIGGRLYSTIFSTFTSHTSLPCVGPVSRRDSIPRKSTPLLAPLAQVTPSHDCLPGESP